MEHTSSGMAVSGAAPQEAEQSWNGEGRNFTIEYRFAENKGAERSAELAADLVRLKVDLIVVTGRPEALAAKKATTTIPIVMANVGDPVGAGLVAQSGASGRQCYWGSRV